MSAWPGARARLAVAVALLLAGGCAATAAGSGGMNADRTRTTPPAPAAPPVLAASAVPGVPSVTVVLTPAGLARQVADPGLAARLHAWGYLAGRQRTFQGESRHLTYVVSRSLRFRDPAGARALVGFVHSSAGALFGAFTTARPLVVRGARGWLLTPPACACHLANPVAAGVVAVGSRVAWLEINGPDATPALLVRLLGAAQRGG